MNSLLRHKDDWYYDAGGLLTASRIIKTQLLNCNGHEMVYGLQSLKHKATN